MREREELKSAKARRLRVEKEQAIENEQEESKRRIATQRATYSANGLRLAGTPTVVLGAMAAESEKRIAQIRQRHEALIAEAEEEFVREARRAAQGSIAHSQNIQVGDHNVQDLRTFVNVLSAAIDASDGTDEAKAEAKAEAKGRLERLLEHPLVSAIVGGAVEGILGRVTG